MLPVPILFPPAVKTATAPRRKGSTMPTRIPRFLGCTVLALLASLLQPAIAGEDPTANETQARQLALVLSAAEKVIADNQDHIDDPAKGDKGLGAAAVLAKAAENYRAMTKEAMPSTDGDSRQAKLNRTLITIITAVMDKAQPLINQQGKGYKSFLPPIFTDQVAREFSRTMDGVAAIRITAPKELIRNRRHRPDEWEERVIETYFKKADWEKGAPFTERADFKGKPATRLLIPQYYDQSCLKCHGEPKGERDINGGIKEGGKLGDLGGAISVIILDEK